TSHSLSQHFARRSRHSIPNPRVSTSGPSFSGRVTAQTDSRRVGPEPPIRFHDSYFGRGRELGAVRVGMHDSEAGARHGSAAKQALSEVYRLERLIESGKVGDAPRQGRRRTE